MNDEALAIILNARQVDRLQRQVTVLYDETFDYHTLKRWRDAWEAELAFLKIHPELLPDVDALLAEMQTGAYSASTLDSARTKTKGHPHCWPSLQTKGHPRCCQNPEANKGTPTFLLAFLSLLFFFLAWS